MINYHCKNLHLFSLHNLGAQIKKLNELGYVEIEKAFIKNKPQTTCEISEYGKKQFKKNVKMLENLLTQSK